MGDPRTDTERSAQTVRLPNGRIVRYKRDQVGNDLTAVLRWCATHHEPTWQFDDDSWRCPETMVVGWDAGDHVIVEGPWDTTRGVV